jgi:alkylhydroperoxidase/carboxymuconolactone decarboxylase family protein YurZ
MDPLEERFRRLSLNDEPLIEMLLGSRDDAWPPTLEAKTAALVRIAALVAMDAETPTYQWAVTEALGCGAVPDEVLGVLVTIAPAVGQARVVSAAPKLGLALGHDVLVALEGPRDIDDASTTKGDR